MKDNFLRLTTDTTGWYTHSYKIGVFFALLIIPFDLLSLAELGAWPGELLVGRPRWQVSQIPKRPLIIYYSILSLRRHLKVAAISHVLVPKRGSVRNQFERLRRGEMSPNGYRYGLNLRASLSGGCPRTEAIGETNCQLSRRIPVRAAIFIKIRITKLDLVRKDVYSFSPPPSSRLWIIFYMFLIFQSGSRYWRYYSIKIV